MDITVDESLVEKLREFRNRDLVALFDYSKARISYTLKRGSASMPTVEYMSSKVGTNLTTMGYFVSKDKRINAPAKCTIFRYNLGKIFYCKRGYKTWLQKYIPITKARLQLYCSVIHRPPMPKRSDIKNLCRFFNITRPNLYKLFSIPIPDNVIPTGDLNEFLTKLDL